MSIWFAKGADAAPAFPIDINAAEVETMWKTATPTNIALSLAADATGTDTW